MLVWSAKYPKTADPRPAIPKANPKNSPEIIPTFPGNNSCAKTKIAEKAEERIKPIITTNVPVQNKST